MAEISHAVNGAKLEELERLQHAVDFMGQHEVPRALQAQVLRWTRFQHTHASKTAQDRNLLSKLSPALQQEMVSCIFGHTLKSVPLFDYLHSEDKSFLSEVWGYMKYLIFAPTTTVVQHAEPATRLLVITSGEVDVLIEPQLHHHAESSLNIPEELHLKAGDFIGDFALLGDEDWGASTMLGLPGIDLEVVASAQHFVVVLMLEASNFERILALHGMRMQAAVNRFRRHRQDHKRDFFYGSRVQLVAGFSLSRQREEATDFQRMLRILRHWELVVGKLCDKHRAGSSPLASGSNFVHKLVTVLHSNAASATKSSLRSYASSLHRSGSHLTEERHDAEITSPSLFLAPRPAGSVRDVVPHPSKALLPQEGTHAAAKVARNSTIALQQAMRLSLSAHLSDAHIVTTSDLGFLEKVPGTARQDAVCGADRRGDERASRHQRPADLLAGEDVAVSATACAGTEHIQGDAVTFSSTPRAPPWRSSPSLGLDQLLDTGPTATLLAHAVTTRGCGEYGIGGQEREQDAHDQADLAGAVSSARSPLSESYLSRRHERKEATACMPGWSEAVQERFDRQVHTSSLAY